MEQLRSYRFSPKRWQSEQSVCVVCHSDFQVWQLLHILPCDQEFHAKCDDKWLMENQTCPICQKAMGQVLQEALAGAAVGLE